MVGLLLAGAGILGNVISGIGAGKNNETHNLGLENTKDS